MKRKEFLIFGLFLLLLMPINAYAKTEKINGVEYTYKNLKETLSEESIELAYPKYKETDDQITIYMFRGIGCGYCQAFLKFINSITEEYGEKFKLKSYEVWQTANNGELMVEVSEFLGEEAGGVPFIVIGDKAFPGYAEVYDEEIKTAIDELYESKNRYDVFDAMAKAKKLEKIKDVISKCVPIVVVAVMILTIVYVNKKYQTLELKIKELETKIEENAIELKEETKKNIKKTTSKKTSKTVKKEKNK